MQFQCSLISTKIAEVHVLESTGMMFEPNWEGQEVLPEKATV